MRSIREFFSKEEIELIEQAVQHLKARTSAGNRSELARSHAIELYIDGAEFKVDESKDNEIACCWIHAIVVSLARHGYLKLPSSSEKDERQ